MVFIVLYITLEASSNSMKKSSQYSNSLKKPFRYLWKKKPQTKPGSFLALVSEDASGGNHFRTLFLGMVSGGLWVLQSYGSA